MATQYDQSSITTHLDQAEAIALLIAGNTAFDMDVVRSAANAIVDQLEAAKQAVASLSGAASREAANR